MANGFFFGGLAEGLQASKTSRQADRELGLRERALGGQEEAEKQDRINTRRKEAKALVDATLETMKAFAGSGAAGPTNRDFLAHEGTRNLLSQVRAIAEATEQPELYAYAVNQARTYQTAQEKASTSGKAKAEEALSQADALQAGGVSQAASTKAAGIAEPEEDKPSPLSPEGKQLADRLMFVTEYGEDSPQVKAFDEMTKKDEEGPKLTDEAGIRKEFTALSKDFVQVLDAFNRITAAGQNPSAAGDLALIFNYMKMLDPGSTVREGEFATAQNSAGIPERIRAYYNRIVTGERLAPEQRQDFLSRAEDLMHSQLRSQVQLETQFRSIAERAEIAPEAVVIDFVGPFRQGGPGGTISKPTIKLDLEGNVIGG